MTIKQPASTAAAPPAAATAKAGRPRRRLRLASSAGVLALATGLAACSSSPGSSTTSSTAKPTTSAAPKLTTEIMTGQVTGAAAVANAVVIPLKMTGAVKTTGTFTTPNSNAAHVTITFPTKAGNLVAAAYAPDTHAAPTVVNAAACRLKFAIHATYTVDGSKSTGTFTDATGSGQATFITEADAPKFTSGSHAGQCNMSSNAQPIVAGALAIFYASGPLTLK